MGIMKKFREENMTVDVIQNEVNDFLQRVSNGSGYFAADFLDLDDGLTEQAKRIIKELNLTNPGENGEPVIIPQTASDKIKELNQTMWKTYGYNALASSLISLNRNLPDKRSDYCKTKKYREHLPKATVMITFYDDDWMLLMRTVHSVLLRTPEHLLEEVLLVQDFSPREYYHEHLDEYLKKYPKIRHITSHKRLGVIAIRNLGVLNAKGEIVVVLDSHVEVTPGWIEPLLDRITEMPNLIAWCKISRINTKTIELRLDDGVGGLGTFRWDMGFEWLNIKLYEGSNPTFLYDPKASVTYMGPCYAHRKDFFIKLGMFDDDFDIWGGEDIEMSFRAWMCGGRVELIPCTVAAHVLKHHTYEMKTKGKGGARFNTDRIAEVWLDEYKRYHIEKLVTQKIVITESSQAD